MLNGFAIIGSLSGGLLFWLTKGSPIAIVPVVLLIVPTFYFLISKISGGYILALLALWAIFIDDISQVAWGREYEAFTELLGITLYESFGISGLEFLSLLFSLAALLKLIVEGKKTELISGLKLSLIMSAFFLASFIALFVGLAQGGSLNVHFIQTRFLHLLPMWSLSAFVFLRGRPVYLLLTGVVVLIFLKSLQAIFIYYTNQAVFAEAEYLVDHYFSMFSVLAVSLSVAWCLCSKQPLIYKLLALLAQIPIIWAFVLNDRRTAFAAVIFGLFVLIGSLTKRMLLDNRQKLIYLALVVAPLVFVSIAGPGPLGFFRRTLLSIVEESSELPSYRDLENANLLTAVASRPLTGLGTGREFEEVYPMPDISFVYDRYRMIPHNLLLAGWAYQGPLGIASLLLMFSFMLATAVTLFRRNHVYLGVGGIFFLTQYFAFTYADLALQIPRNQLYAGLLVGAMYAVLSKDKT